MVNETPMVDSIDPLDDVVGISLLPTTIRASIDKPDDPESIHNFMKSKEMKSDEKVTEAKSIVDNGGELLDTELRSSAQSLGIDWDLEMKDKDKPQERRPGLRRRRVQFTFKPRFSQPVVTLGPSLDLDKLTDPVEYFNAAAKLEAAEKELKRLQGISSPDQEPEVDIPRPRRPGILNKTVTFKPRFESIQSENDDASILSQETLEHDNLGDQSSALSQDPRGKDDVELEEADLTGSITNKENKLNEIFDELMSSNVEDLEGEIALSKLQERLQIKPIELGSLCITDFSMTGKTDGKGLVERTKNPKKFSLDIHGLFKRNKTTEGTPSTYKQYEEERPANKLASPTPPKTLSSLSLFKKQILQSNPLRDPFSPLNIDLDNNDPQSEHLPQESPHVNESVEPDSYRERKNLADWDNVDSSMINMDSDGLEAEVVDVSDVNCVMKDQQDLETESHADNPDMQDGEVPEVPAEVQPSLQAQEKADNADNSNPVEVGSSKLIPQNHTKEGKQLARGRRERKTLSSRPSLLDAGTSFESGARRSKRQRTRPLKYWQGEKLLYGRVDKSLKLVGVRFLSPTKGSYKVQSYISDTFRDVVDLAARH